MARKRKLKVKSDPPAGEAGKLTVKTAIIAFALLFTVIGLLFSGYRFLSPWNGKDPVNAVISSGENFWVVSLRPEENRAVEISIPKTAVIEVDGKGKWQARALWDISRLENDPSLAAAVGWNLLEVPIDFTIRLPEWKGRETDLGRSLRQFQVIKFLRSLDPSRIKTIDLADVNTSRRVVDPGGVELVEINSELLSPLVSEWFLIDSIRQEGLSVAIRNNSSRSGAGAILSRQLEHVGLRVVSVADGGGGNILTVKSKDIKKSLSVRKLTSWLDSRAEVSDFPERADILIVVK